MLLPLVYKTDTHQYWRSRKKNLIIPGTQKRSVMIAVADVTSLRIRARIARRRIHEGDLGSPHPVLDHRTPRLNDRFSQQCAPLREIPPCPHGSWRPEKCHLDLSRYILQLRCPLRKGRRSIRRDRERYLSILSSRLRTVVTGWRNHRSEGVINVTVSTIICDNSIVKDPVFTRHVKMSFFTIQSVI